MKHVSVAGFGDNIVDRFLDRNLGYPGGNAVNVAVFAARAGARAGYLGTFGDDAAGRHLQASIEAEGVDCAHSRVVEGESGWTNIDLIDGDRTFLEWNEGGVSAADPPRLTGSDLAWLGEYALVHTSVYSNVDEQLGRLRSGTSGLVSYDFSDHLEELGDLTRVSQLDLVQLSAGDLPEEELDGIFHSLRSVPVVLATRGPKGAAAQVGDTIHRVRAQPLQGDIVDTMGCGDAFLAAFVLSLLRAGWRRRSLPTSPQVMAALAAGANLSARQCLVEGAFGHGIPLARLR